MTYKQALEYIHKVSWRGSRPGLERIKKLCELLNDPQDSLKFVHVAGTNGKGSVCSMLTSVLIASGKNVGTFTSPYIARFNDRICFNGEEISDGELAGLVEEIAPIAESMEDPPTEFELITAIGFLYFKRKKCDIVVLEVGMGGRFDSTNVIKESLLSVITGIDYDHMAILGDTLEKIAWEKAGIIKKGCPVLVGNMADEPFLVIKNEAEAKSLIVRQDNSSLFVHSQTLEGTEFDYKGHTLKIKLLGTYQKYNAALVVSACEILGISRENIKKGLENARWRARFELLSASPVVIYDGGHNKQGVTSCVESIKTYFETKVNLVTGVMRDKTYREMAELFAPVTENAVTLKPDNPRALDANEYASVFEALGIKSCACESEADAVKTALEKQRENGYPVVCAGSLYMYERLSKEIKKALQ